MNDNRVRRLRQLLTEVFNGSQTELSKRSGISLAQLGQYFSGYRNMGEKVARRIEDAAGKPRGWLDSDDSNKPLLSEDDRVHLATWQSASAEAREVARFALSDIDAPLPAWADKDMRKDIHHMIYTAHRWLRKDQPQGEEEFRKRAAA